ncbi:MAG: CapA family protein [Woeseiaceae bacterium]|nr:CapA family protein [Woeseiaceae bacterium]
MTSSRALQQRLIAALMLLLAASCATDRAPVEPPDPKPQAVAEPEIPAPAEPPPDRSALRLSIAAVGDMMIGTDYPQDHLPDDDGVGFLADVAPYLASADIAFGNLEGVLLDGGEPGKKCSNPSACYLFRSPTRYAHHFRAAGFDVLSLANNHARDFGEEGRSSSMQAIAAAGMHHSGRVDDFASLEVNGISVAVLAYAVTRNSNMMLDYELAFATAAAYAESHDVVLVSFHGGAEGVAATRIPFADEEYYGEPRGDVVWFARGMIDAGADIVIGHGPHVVRGMERYKGRLIAYSLGNFATYYGISVAGIKGVAPILMATVDGDGAFVEGRIVSTVQRRPAGPSIDAGHRALDLVRGLSRQDFGKPGLLFLPDGRVLPVARPPVEPHVLQTADEATEPHSP